jgi:hypothetical protein
VAARHPMRLLRCGGAEGVGAAALLAVLLSVDPAKASSGQIMCCASLNPHTGARAAPYQRPPTPQHAACTVRS